MPNMPPLRVFRCASSGAAASPEAGEGVEQVGEDPSTGLHVRTSARSWGVSYAWLLSQVSRLPN